MNNALSSVILLIALTGLTACNDTSDSPQATGSITIAVTDSPIDDANAVWIQFLGINLYDADGYKTEVTFDQPRLVDLLSLQGRASEEVLVDYPVNAGDYSYLTFSIDFNESYLVAGTDHIPLEISDLRSAETFLQDIILNGSDASPSILPFSVQEGANTHLTFDFDLRKSIYDDGNSNIYSFSPAIRSVITSESANIAGTIDGAVNFNTSSCVAENTAVYAFAGSNQSTQDIRGTSGDPFSTSNITNTAGVYTYELGFLPAGDYTIAIACTASSDTANQIEPMIFKGKQTITVAQGESLIANF